MTGHLLLVDASGFAYRAYYTGANQFREDGLPTWAITGFLALLWRMLGAASVDQPTHGAAVFDTVGGRSFRRDLFPDYKRNRPARDEELSVQLPYMRHAADALGLHVIESGTFWEADDMIATLATRAAERGWRVTVVGSDKDLFQLVKNDAIEIVDTVSKRRIREADVERMFGVPPRLMAELQALAGDPVDNVPGIDGIGLQTAAGLLRLFQSLDAIVDAHARGNTEFFGPRTRVALRDAREKLAIYLELTTLKTDVPLPDEIFAAMAMRPVEREHVMDFLKVIGAAAKFEAMFSTDTQLFRMVQTLAQGADPFEWWTEELKAPGQAIPDDPQCGFYERRLVRGGVPVPCKIWREPARDGEGLMNGEDVLLCLIGDRGADAVREWPRLAQYPITEARYRFEVADRKWCVDYAPNEPKARPDMPVDHRALPPPVFEKRRGRRV